jgi:hypothetical protein
MVQPQILQGDPHRWRESRSILEFHLDPVAAASLQEKEIQFGARVCGPEICCFRSHQFENRFDGESLP